MLLPRLNIRSLRPYPAHLIILALLAGFFLLPLDLVWAQDVSWWDPSTWIDWVMSQIAVLVHAFLVGIPGLLVWLTGLLLNFAIRELIINMGELVLGTSGIGYVVNLGWSMIRDVMNIAFIFGLIYIGLRTILFAADTNTRRTLGLLIAAALLVNFSLFITKGIIDFTNVMAVELYNLIDQRGVVDAPDYGYSGISGAYMDVLGVHSLTASTEIVNQVSEHGIGAAISFSFMSMIFLFVAAIVFAAGAFMVIIRFVALIIYMIFSPIMFLGWVLPWFKSQQDSWWQGFLKYAFFAPAYIFMTFITLRILTSYMGLTLSQNTDGSIGKTVATGDSSAFAIVLVFCVAIAMMVATILVAQKMSLAGASTSIGMAKGARNFGMRTGGAMTAGLAARAGRNTVGQWAQRIADRDSLQEAASKKGFRGNLARRTLKTSRAVGDASFDARRVGGVGKKLGIGEGAKGGYKTRRDDIEKAEKKFAASLGTVGDDDPQIRYLKELKTEQQEALKAPGITDAQKAEIQTNIKKLDQHLKEEKYRRQTGGAIENIEPEEFAQLEEKKAAIVSMRRRFRETAVENIRERKNLVATIARLEKEQKEIEHGIRAGQGLLGYAGVLEARSIKGSAWYGRMQNQDHAAGKAIRKQYDKKVKQSKDEERHAELKAALKDKDDD